MKIRGELFALLLTFATGIGCGYSQNSSPQPLENGNGVPDGYIQAAQVPAQVTILRAALRDTSNIMNNVVTVKLTAPSGTTGDFSLYLPSGFSEPTGLVYSLIPFTALAPGSQVLKLPFDKTISPGEYHDAHGIWDANVAGSTGLQTVDAPDYTFPKKWDYFRRVFYTQYNVPHESECPGGDTDAWIVDSSCSFTQIKLNAAFVSAAWLNGTGIDRDNDILQSAFALNLGDTQKCAGKYPSGAIGHGKFGGNTFEIVPALTGSCTRQTLTPDSSVAVPATKVGKIYRASSLSGVVPLSCSQELNLDAGSYTTTYKRTAADLCPACSDPSTFKGADGHIDSFSSDPSCSGRDVGNLGFFYTSIPTK